MVIAPAPGLAGAPAHLPMLPSRSAYLGDGDVPGACTQFVDLGLGDVGAFLGVVQLMLHLAVLHQVGVGLLLLGRERGEVGAWGTGDSGLRAPHIALMAPGRQSQGGTALAPAPEQ